MKLLHQHGHEFRKVHVALLLAGAALAGWILLKESPEESGRVHYYATAADFCNLAHDGRVESGSSVRVVFKLPLVPTSDPRVFEYRPGRPAGKVAPTVRVVFTDPPAAGRVNAVVGTFSRVEYDSVLRPSRQFGVAVITSATPAPAPSP